MDFQPDGVRASWQQAVTGILLAVMCVSLPGCMGGWFHSWAGRNPFVQPAPCVLPQNVSLPELVAHLNGNIERLSAWRSTDVRIRARSTSGLPVSLSASIAVERPRNFRLRASSPLGDEVDLGSNAQRFWFWARRGGPKRIFTARHDEMHIAQQRLQIPFQPDWILEALGVIPIDGSQMTLQRDGRQAGRVSLISDRLSPDGRPVRQVILVDACYGRILEQTLFDSAGRLIAKATLSNHQTDPANGITLPHRIDLNWPRAGLALIMRLGTVEINPPSMPEQTWQLPRIPGYPPFDLGRQDFRRQVSAVRRMRTSSRHLFADAADHEEPPWERHTENRYAQPVNRRSHRWQPFRNRY